MSTHWILIKDILTATLILLIGVITSNCTTSNFDRGSLVYTDIEKAEIPFDWKSDLIIINATVNGVEGKFLLDNGFSLSAISKEFSESANINFKNKSNLTDANNASLKTLESTAESIEIAGFQFINTGIYQIDPKNFFPCDNIDGVIGASILNKINFQIDFIQQKILFSRSPINAIGVILDIEISPNNSSFVNLTIRDETIKCKIDLGRSGGLKLDRERWISLFLNERAISYAGMTSLSASGIGNADTTHKLLEPTLFTYNGKELPIQGEVSLKGNQKYPGYLGLGYLKNYKLTVNSLEKKYSLSDAYQEKDTNEESEYGLSFYDMSGKWQIVSLNIHNPAARELPLFETIDSIDQRPMHSFLDICSFQDYLEAKKKEGSDLRIHLKKSRAWHSLPLRPPSNGILK